MWFWHPSREEIENWVESKEKEFTEQENRNLRLSAEDLLQSYVFTDLHEIFFATFPTELHVWLSILAENKTSIRSDRPAEWTPKAILNLKHIDNSISRAIDLWLNSLLDWFVTEFAVDTLKAYNKEERYFFKGYRGCT